jgi:tetratricopeptide (TPR) repeat protein
VKGKVTAFRERVERSYTTQSWDIKRRKATVYLALALSVAEGATCAGRCPQGPVLPALPPSALDKISPNGRTEIEKAYASVSNHPKDPSVNGRLGMLLHAYNFLPEAEVCYRRAHLLDPSSFRWAYYLGLIELHQRKCNDAVAIFDESLRLNPNYLPAQLRKGECLLVSNEWEEAREVYEAIIRTHTDSAEAYYGLGRVRSARKDFNAAIQSFRKACELFPNFSTAHFAMARAYQRLGRTELAREELELAKKSGGGLPEIEDPLLSEIEQLYRDYNVYLKLAEELGATGKLKDAADAYEEALIINPQIPEAHNRLIYIYGQLGQVAKAEEHYRASVKLDPNKAEAYLNYGILSLNQGNSREAEELFRTALQIDPRNPQAHGNLGYILESEGKTAQAIAELRKALETRPDFPQAQFSLGRMLLKQENYEEGIPHLLRALSTDDEEIKSSYLHALGIAYADLGDLLNAVRYMHLSREKAAALHQANLLERIDQDLEMLEGKTAHN